MAADKTAKVDQASQLLRMSEQLAQAEHLRCSRQFDKAESICAGLLRQYPDFFGAHYTLGLIHADRDDHVRALPHLLRAVMRGPRNAVASVTLAGVLIEADALDLAGHILDLAAQWAPDDPSLLVSRGELHHRRGDYASACDCFHKALAAEPALEEAAIGLARAHFALGAFEDGAAVLNGMIARGHVSADILFTLSQAPDRWISHDLLALADQAQQKVVSTDINSFACLDFVRAGALHRAGDHARAWAKACDANKRIHAQRQAQIKTLSAQHKDSLAHLSQLGTIKPRVDASRPVSLFIMGPSRSGKTSLERLVSQLPSVKRHYERSLVTEATRWTFQSVGMADMFPLHLLPPNLREMFCERYFELLGETSGEERLHTFTNPLDVTQVSSVMRHVPNVRIVCLKRNHDDLAFRIFMSHYNVGNAYAYDLKAIDEHLASYDQLIDGLVAAAPDLVRVVTYDELVADPQSILARVTDLCGLPASDVGEISVGDDRACAAPYLDLMKR